MCGLTTSSQSLGVSRGGTAADAALSPPLRCHSGVPLRAPLLSLQACWHAFHLLFLSFLPPSSVIFRVYDVDNDGKISRSDLLTILRDLSGTYLTDEQREVRGRGGGRERGIERERDGPDLIMHWMAGWQGGEGVKTPH